MLRLLTLSSLTLMVAAGSPTPQAQAAETIVVKLATMAPEGTGWHKALRQMGDKWTELSGGRVEVKIYAGGVAGNEGAMVRKMRIGQLHGGSLTNLGLSDIDPSPQVTQTPMLIRSYQELDHVMEQMAPDFEKRMLAKGFVVVSWGDAGWVHWFTSGPMKTPSEASKFKAFTFEGDPVAAEIMRKIGFEPVVLAATDVLPSLQSGLINAFPQTPLAALALQWFAKAQYMLDVPWAPLLGATVISKAVWDQIPAELHGPFAAAAREVSDDLRMKIRKQDRKAIKVMQKYGLQVVEADAAAKSAWEQLALGLHDKIRGAMVPADVFDKAKALVAAYRKK